MERMTKPAGQGVYRVARKRIEAVENGYAGEAVERLARFEQFLEDLLNAQDELSAQLEFLRNEDKTRSVKFRELMGRKLQNTDILIRLKQYGLE